MNNQETNTLTALEVDAITGIETVRQLTEDELSAIEIQKNLTIEADQIKANRESALAKLAALGLTEEEIEAL